MEKKKAGVAGAIFRGVLFMTVYLVVMSVFQLIGLVPILVSAVTEAGGDLARFQEIYLRKIGEEAATISLVTFIGTLVAAAVMVVWYIFRVYKKSVKLGTYESVLLKLKNKKSILFLLCGTFAGFFTAVAIEDLTEMLMPNFSTLFNAVMGSVVGGVDVLGLILAVVLAPIGEEVCLRGLALDRARKTFGLAGCMIYSAIMFGILHLNPIQGLYAIPIGLFLGFVAYKYKSVIPCIIVHAINNLVGSFASGEWITRWYIPACLAVVFAALMIIMGRDVEFLKNNQGD